jgi:hypothetical protein
MQEKAVLEVPSPPSPVSVDASACARLAKLIASREVPPDGEDNGRPGLPRDAIGNFYLLLVAVCHQTSPVGLPQLEGMVNSHHRRGWDYLAGRLELQCLHDLDLLTVERWSKMTGEQFADLMRDPQYGDRITDPTGRAAIIRDLGETMLERQWRHADDLFELAHGRISVGAPNLLGLLSRSQAYRDPVRKKSYFFLALMRNAGLWRYADPENLGAPVDYHEVRGHLRLGTVRVTPMLRDKLMSRTLVTEQEDIAIRMAVHDAIMKVSEMSGVRDPSRLHYLFWNVFRSCCTRLNPHCDSCPPTCPLPARYVPLAIHADGRRRCAFSGVCESRGREPKLIEQHCDTDFY